MTVTASKYARAENDLYQTEPWVTEALLRHFPIDGMSVWEPAAGNHLMADVLREHTRWPQRKQVGWNGGKTMFYDLNETAQARMF